MKKIFLAASLALLPLVFACQPELDASSEQEPCATCKLEVAMPEETAVPHTVQSPDEPTTLERNGTTSDANRNGPSSGDLRVMGLMAGTPYASMVEVETMRDEQQGWIHVETAFYVTFWADIARTIPVNLGSAIQLNYQHRYYNYLGNYPMTSNLSTNLQPGSHSYYIGTGTYECNYGANGDPEYRCDESWFNLRSGVGYYSHY